jgi:hypothetical protein
MANLKTLDEHREYLYQTVKLQFFFLRNWLREHPDETLSAVLRNRIDIYRKTSINKDLLNPAEAKFECPEWLELEHRLESVYEQYKDDAPAFEDAAFAVCKNTIAERVEKDYNDKSRTAGYQCGSLRYNEHEDGLKHETISFHIANALQPESFFADPQYLPQCFLELMRQTAEKYRSTRLYTGTWLNSLPRWLELFPQEWQDNLSPENTDVQWHYGFWGQFITARGTFNYKYGEIMRQTGKMPFYPKTSSCSFETLKKHLKEKYNVSD